MRGRPFILCALGLIAAIVCVCLWIVPQEHAPAAAPAALTAAPAQGAYALFDGLAVQDVAALSIETEHAAYAFTRHAQQISLNGRQADAEVFSTLLEQLLTLPVVTIEPFTPPPQATVTVTLDVQNVQHRVRFYRDESIDNPYVRIISGDETSLRHQQTDAWRLGTMLLTCEGTRIQDEAGQEKPL